MAEEPTNAAAAADNSYLGRFRRWWQGKKKETDDRKPVEGCFVRLENIIRMHHKGIIGTIVPLAALSWQGVKNDHVRTVQLMWLLMIWFFIWQPVSVQITGIMPLYFLAMTGVMNTNSLCKCYYTEGIMLFTLGGMLILVLNNSGVDKRVAVAILSSGGTSQFRASRMVFKYSTAAFFLSLFSSRLIVTSFLTQYANQSFVGLKAFGEDQTSIQHVINNAIQTSSTIGSMGIIHASFGVLTMRALYYALTGYAHDDIMNYLQYSAFAFPTVFVMFIINLIYHTMLVSSKKDLSLPARVEIQRLTADLRANISTEVSLHEKLSVILLTINMLMFFFRRSTWLAGWAQYRNANTHPDVYILDSTVAAIFVMAFHLIPNRYRFFNYATAKVRSDLPPLRPESGLLWWKFVNSNVNYGYFMLIGGGVALIRVLKHTKYDTQLAAPSNVNQLMFLPYIPSLLILCICGALLSNIMTQVAAIVAFLPYITAMASQGAWIGHMHIACVAIGMSCNLGFCSPFLYTPAYYSYHTGKTPALKMIKYALGSIVICVLILWLSLIFWSPVIWATQLKIVPPAVKSPTSPKS